MNGSLAGFLLSAGVVSVCVALTACHEASERPTHVVVDSGGVRFVESTAAEVTEWHVTTEPEVELGVVNGSLPYQFESIAAAYILENGRIVVADRGARQLRWFDHSGQHVRTVGGRGRGPGEFSLLTSVVRLPGDSLLVHDRSNQRIAIIAPDGEIARLTSTTLIPALGPRSAVIGRMSTGELVATIVHYPDFVVYRSGYIRDTLLVTVTVVDGLQADTVLQIPSTESVAFENKDRGDRGLTIRDRFSHEAHVAVWGDLIVSGTGEEFELRVVDIGGRLRSVFRRSDASPIPVKGALVEAYLRSVAEREDPRSVQLVAEQLAHFEDDRWAPAYGEVIVDDLGYLWVSDYTGPARTATALEWTVMDRDGIIVARVRTPAGLKILQIGSSYVIGSVRGALDVEYVRVHSLARR